MLVIVIVYGNYIFFYIFIKRSKNPWQRPKEKEKELSKEERKTAVCYFQFFAILCSVSVMINSALYR